MNFEKRLNECKYIYLVNYTEGPESKMLRIAVDEARLGEPKGIDSGNKDLDRIFAGGRPIEVSAECARFEITFPHYLAFSIVDETYSQGEEGEDYSKRLRRHEASAFLDYIKVATWDGSQIYGSFEHYALVCENHVINVAAIVPPTIKIIER
ncbi:MAG: hypothetical protein AAF198_00345 [Pseudomonadota bacterium]